MWPTRSTLYTFFAGLCCWNGSQTISVVCAAPIFVGLVMLVFAALAQERELVQRAIPTHAAQASLSGVHHHLPLRCLHIACICVLKDGLSKRSEDMLESALPCMTCMHACRASSFAQRRRRQVLAHTNLSRAGPAVMATRRKFHWEAARSRGSGPTSTSLSHRSLHSAPGLRRLFTAYVHWETSGGLGWVASKKRAPRGRATLSGLSLVATEDLPAPALVKQLVLCNSGSIKYSFSAPPVDQTPQPPPWSKDGRFALHAATIPGEAVLLDTRKVVWRTAMGQWCSFPQEPHLVEHVRSVELRLDGGVRMLHKRGHLRE